MTDQGAAIRTHGLDHSAPDVIGVLRHAAYCLGAVVSEAEGVLDAAAEPVIDEVLTPHLERWLVSLLELAVLEHRLVERIELADPQLLLDPGCIRALGPVAETVATVAKRGEVGQLPDAVWTGHFTASAPAVVTVAIAQGDVRGQRPGIPRLRRIVMEGFTDQTADRVVAHGRHGVLQTLLRVAWHGDFALFPDLAVLAIVDDAREHPFGVGDFLAAARAAVFLQDRVSEAAGGPVGRVIGRGGLLDQAIEHIVLVAGDHTEGVLVFDQMAADDRLRRTGSGLQGAAWRAVGLAFLQPGRLPGRVIDQLVAPAAAGGNAIHAELMLVEATVQMRLVRQVQVAATVAVQQRFVFLGLIEGDLEGILLRECEPAFRPRLKGVPAQAREQRIAIAITFDRRGGQRLVVDRGGVDRLAFEVAHEAFRVRRAAVALRPGIVLAHGAYAIGVDLFDQVAKRVIAGLQGFRAPVLRVALQGPGLGHRVRQLKEVRLVGELQVGQFMVGGGDGFNAALLGSDLFGHQVETVEAAFDGAQYLAIEVMAGGGVVAEVGLGRLVEVVLALVGPGDAGAIAEKVIAAEGVGVLHVGGFIQRIRLENVFGGIGQRACDPRKRVTVFLVGHRLDATDGVGQASQVVQAANGSIGEVPARLVGAGQGDPGQLVAFQAQGEAGMGVGRGVQVEQYPGVAAVVDAQQGALAVVADRRQARLAVEDLIRQVDAMPGGRQYPHRQGHVEAWALGFEDFDKARFMGNAQALVFAFADVAELEAFQFALRDDRGLPRAVIGDLEAFAGVQLEHAIGEAEAGQFKAPADAEAAVAFVHRVEAQLQGQIGAAQCVGVECRQVDAQCILAGAWVDTALNETHEVEGIGMQRHTVLQVKPLSSVGGGDRGRVDGDFAEGVAGYIIFSLCIDDDAQAFLDKVVRQITINEVIDVVAVQL